MSKEQFTLITTKHIAMRGTKIINNRDNIEVFLEKVNFSIYYSLKNLITKTGKLFKQVRFNIIMIRNDEYATKEDVIFNPYLGLIRCKHTKEDEFYRVSNSELW